MTRTNDNDLTFEAWLTAAELEGVRGLDHDRAYAAWARNADPLTYHVSYNNFWESD